LGRRNQPGVTAALHEDAGAGSIAEGPRARNRAGEAGLSVEVEEAEFERMSRIKARMSRMKE
jgi:hypothetical protein